MPHWFTILSWNTTDHILTVAIRGERYVYKLHCHSDTARHALYSRRRNLGQQLAWVKSNAHLLA